MMRYEEYHALIEEALTKAIQTAKMPERLREAIAYSLLSGGKRLRPVLLLAAYSIKREDVQTALPYAVALEMIHTYSLIHDDLPAMDDDDLRRGNPTNHKVFGEGMAILAGDGLLHLAFETMLGAALKSDAQKAAVMAMEAIARRSGVGGMVGGQVMDVSMEGQKPTEECLTYIHTHKTADLITAAIEAGLRLAGATEAEVQAGCEYGFHLGMAFQMVDDLLDVVGNEKLLGKKTGMDSQHDKMTWVALRGVEKTQEQADSHIIQAVEALALFDEKGKFLETLANSTRYRVK
jgi:Geranylgeranyl pyrophosphate synthase